MPYRNKEQYNAYLRDYMKKRRAVKPTVVKPDNVKPYVNPEYETVVIGGTPFRRPI